MSNSNYYDPATLEVLKKQMYMSPETWHKVMNPLCAQCAIERAQTNTQFLAN